MERITERQVWLSLIRYCNATGQGVCLPSSTRRGDMAADLLERAKSWGVENIPYMDDTRDRWTLSMQCGGYKPYLLKSGDNGEHSAPWWHGAHLPAREAVAALNVAASVMAATD